MAQRADIPEDVLRFISRRIDSVPHLEALLLLWESPNVSWAETQIARRIYVSPEQARRILADLGRHRLVVADPQREGQHRFDPAWDSEGVMERVSSSYRRHLVHVANLIHTKAASEAVRDFARAFQFRSED
jgi:hypothetical protein